MGVKLTLLSVLYSKKTKCPKTKNILYICRAKHYQGEILKTIF